MKKKNSTIMLKYTVPPNRIIGVIEVRTGNGRHGWTETNFIRMGRDIYFVVPYSHYLLGKEGKIGILDYNREGATPFEPVVFGNEEGLEIVDHRRKESKVVMTLMNL